MEPTTKKRRGFAVMDRALVSQIARKGGQAAHAAGTAHEFSPEEAREAGRKGGKATHARRGHESARTDPNTGTSPTENIRGTIADLPPESNHPGFKQHEDVT